MTLTAAGETDLLARAVGNASLPEEYRMNRAEGVSYAAREGEPIRYQGRNVRATQTWERFPVGGMRPSHEVRTYATCAEAQAGSTDALLALAAAIEIRDASQGQRLTGMTGQPIPVGLSSIYFEVAR